MELEPLERLSHIQAIRDQLARYWRGVDRCDAELVRSTYHADAYDDHGYYKGPIDGFLESLPAVVWPTFHRTQHFSGHTSVELETPDRARAESYAEAHHILRADDGTAKDLVYGLRYVDRFELRDGLWKIAHRVCTWDWQRTDEGVGMPLEASYFRGSRDREDPAFEHPQRTGAPVSADDLIAKRACYDALARYARGVDRCDPEVVRSTYHADAYDDHGGYQGDVDGFLAWVKATVMDTFSATMHQLGNSLIEVDGDRAFAETYAVAHHVLGQLATPTDLIMGVRYLDRFERSGNDWKVAHRVMSFEWERSVEAGAQTFPPGSLSGARDGSDGVLHWKPAPPPAATQAAARACDRDAIYAQLVRYSRGVDRRDDALLREAYWPDATDHHGVFEGDLEGFIRFVNDEVHLRFRCTMHRLGNALIEFTSQDEAHCESYAVAHHVRAEDGRDIDDLVMGIRYLDRFERRGDAWRIARREVIYEWQRLDRLEPLDPEWTLGQTDRTDPVYP